jgi:hypothetical protein
MPLFACGFEAPSVSYLRRLGMSPDGASFEQKLVHRSSNGYGGDYSLHVTGQIEFPSTGSTSRWWHGWLQRAEGDSSPIGIGFNYRGTLQVAVRFNSDGFVQFRRGNINGALLATSATPLDVNQGYWLALEVVCQNSGGIMNLYLGDDVTPFMTFTGDTRQASDDGWNQSRIFQGDFYVDDVIITDATEGRSSEVFGRGIRVASDQGVNFTPSQGSLNYQNVYDLDGRYNSVQLNDTEDLYGVEPGLVFGPIEFVAVQGLLGSSNDLKGRLALRSGSTTVFSSDFGGSSDYGGRIDYYIEDPDTVASWTTQGVLDMRIGVRSQV